MGLPVTFSYSSSILSRKTVDTSDNALMSAVAAGTVSKLAVLFERHHRALYRSVSYTHLTLPTIYSV